MRDIHHDELVPRHAIEHRSGKSTRTGAYVKAGSGLQCNSCQSTIKQLDNPFLDRRVAVIILCVAGKITAHAFAVNRFDRRHHQQNSRRRTATSRGLLKNGACPIPAKGTYSPRGSMAAIARPAPAGEIRSSSPCSTIAGTWIFERMSR